jgi:ferrous iron transport protein B
MTVTKSALMVHPDFKIDYGFELENEIETIVEEINQHSEIVEKYPARWIAIKLLEEDRDIQIKLLAVRGGSNVLKISQNSIAQLRRHFGEELDIHIADRRYQWINQLVRSAVHQPATASVYLSDRLDTVLTHRIFGIPIFLAVMWVVFKLTAEVSAPYLDWIDSVISGPITKWIIQVLGYLGLSGSWFESLLVDGVIAGVGGVLVFVPVLTFLYFSLAVLEDTGYMSRGAYVMDRLMNAIGLQGKSFLPMIVGFGCTVPAFYATRTLENEKDRILTGLLVPFMSCGARLPVYILFGAIFFADHAGTMVFSMYLLGILTALVVGFFLRKTVFKGKEQSALIIELPPYRVPNLKSIGIYIQKRVGAFLRNATTIILAVSVILWLLMAIPVQGEGSFANTDVNDSVFARISKAVSPIFIPLGFGSWEATSSLMTGIVAKEVIVSTMGQVYGLQEMGMEIGSTTFFEDIGEIFASFLDTTIETLKSIPLIIGIDLFDVDEVEQPTELMGVIYTSFDESSRGYAILAGLAFMVFVLLYTPCMVAVSAEKQELGTKWMWVSIIGQFILAWLMAFIVFQFGKLIF